MASRRERSTWRNRKTKTTEKTQADPVVIQQKPEPEVIEAIRAMPDTDRVTVPVSTKPETGSKYGELKFFNAKFIDALAKVPADLMFYLQNQEKAYRATRATNIPGDDEKAAKLLERLNELRRIVAGLGYNV